MREDDPHTTPLGGSSDDDRTVPAPADARVGMTLGPYSLRQKIAEGGMGEVWLAEQTTPVRRRVALKIVKLGMDSKEVIARFEAERQALALMNHSSVAKVFDAGCTPNGRPYFAMEYVPGIPITEYCDSHRLALRDRLRIFQQVCEGVQHAHHKAIIHRDLKPSNVLVMEQDGRPIPKIIDFGIAKATSQRLTEKTMFTQLGVLIGTPEYMSPEQADLTGEDVDTRTDVYSLGVILYELLSGALPFDATELRRAGFDGIRRIIRDREPPRPSTRISTLGDDSGVRAASRQTSVSAWEHKLRGDLDWITMKSLEKDRGRRYPTPMDLAKDIDRHLNDLPVEARPPTLVYRASRFVRRNRVAVSFSAAVFFLVIGSGVALTVLYARSLEAERLAANEAATSSEALEFMTDLFRGADPFQRGGELPDALELLDSGAERLTQLENQPQVQVRLMETMGDVYRELGSWDRAREILGAALDKRVELAGTTRDLGVAQTQWLLGYTEVLAERYERAEELLLSSLETRLALLGEEDKDVVDTRHLIAFCYVRVERFAEAVEQSSQVVRVASRRYRDQYRDYADYLYVHAWALSRLSKFDEAIPYFEEAVRVRREHTQWEAPSTGWILNQYGLTLIRTGEEDQIRRGLDFLEQALQVNSKIFDGHHAEIGFNKINISVGHAALGDFVLAEKFAREAVDMARNFFDDAGFLGTFTHRLAGAVAGQKRYPEAEAILLDLLDRQKKLPRTEEQQRRTEQKLTELYEQWGDQGRLDAWRTRVSGSP